MRMQLLSTSHLPLRRRHLGASAGGGRSIWQKVYSSCCRVTRQSPPCTSYLEVRAQCRTRLPRLLISPRASAGPFSASNAQS